jgi:hypothetical protein
MRSHTLTLLAVCLALTAAGSLRAGENPRAVLEKAVKAHGGEQKLARLQAVRMKSTGTVQVNGAAARFTADSCSRLPDRSKVTLLLEIGDVKLTLVQVLNGKRAWSNLEGETEELGGERLAEQQARMHLSHVCSLLPLLKDRNFTLSPLGEVKVNDRPAVGVRAEHKGQKDINLYFDRDSGLLLKSERRGLDLNQKEVTRETFYSAYREVEGLRQAMKLLIHHDGQRYMEMEITELTCEDSIDDGEFARP